MQKFLIDQQAFLFFFAFIDAYKILNTTSTNTMRHSNAIPNKSRQLHSPEGSVVRAVFRWNLDRKRRHLYNVIIDWHTPNYTY